MNNIKSSPLFVPIVHGISGFLGWFSGRALGHRCQSSSEILQLVINDFKKEGNIDGSWIDSKPTHFQRYAIRTMAYRGGIQRKEDNELVTYNFIADAYTGSILDVKRESIN